MSEYRYLKNALAEFSSDLGYSAEEYESAFRIQINASPEYAAHVKDEIVEALGDSQWSWVAAASEVEFIGADDNEENVWETVKSLIWPIVSPDEDPPAWNTPN